MNCKAFLPTAFFLFLFCALGAQNTGTSKLEAFRMQEAQINANSNRNAQWQFVGPDNTSGRCTDVEAEPGNPQVFYAGFATSGVWKTINGGKDWQPIFDKQGTLSIGDLAIAPSNPQMLYVGTGEANIFRASLPGMGVYLSRNGGLTFENIGLENTGTISRILVDPTNPEKVWVAASGNEWTENEARGVFMTENAGKSWKKILFESSRSGCIDLVMDPTNPKIMYASFWSRQRKRWSDPVPEDGDHLYKSEDGGNTWKIIGEGLPPTEKTGRIGLALAASSPNILYAFVDDHSIKRDPLPGETDSYERKVQKVVVGGAVYRSDDRGVHWVKKGEVHDFFKPFSGTYGWVFSQIRVHPQNPDMIFALGVNIGQSSDAGVTWKKFEPSAPNSEYIHGDNHAMWIRPENPSWMLLGNDGGVSLTQDGGKTWDNFFDKTPTTQFYTLAYDFQKPFRIFGSVQDEGTMMGSSHPDSTGHFPWQHVPGGEGTQIQPLPENDQVYFASSYYGRLLKADLSKKGKSRETPINQFDVGRIDSLRGEWLAATLVSKFNSKVVYHGLQHLYQSVDQGKSWKIISPDLTGNNPSRMGAYPYLIYHQAITSISEGMVPGTLYVGTDDGRVWITRNDGKDWESIESGLPKYKHVAKLTASRFFPSRVYLALNDRRSDNNQCLLYRSENDGKTWDLISSKLPQAPVNVVIEDLKNPDMIWCGTDMGVYKSDNKGLQWECYNGNLPIAVAVSDLFIHPRDKVLVLSTYGRGVYLLKR